ncbi:MAG: LacI family DNA-binding transcriptional regulator [Bryobacteraceae bacterium]
MAVTIKDVAKRARVAVGTVSRVINGRTDVHPNLRARVDKAIQELRYRPNLGARNLGRNSSPILSFILSNRSFTHPFHAHILQGVEEYCERSGYFVLFARFDYSGETSPSSLRLPGVLQSHGIADCVILSGTNYENFLVALDGLGMRHVRLGNNTAGAENRPPGDQVRFDDYGGLREATRHLIELGHRDIWFIGDTSFPWVRARHAAYRHEMSEAGLEPRGFTAGLASDPFMNGLNSVDFILEKRYPATAMICANDDNAYGAWQALDQHKLEVPGDVSLIGFDDQHGPLRMPPLTSVKVKTKEVGWELARMAIEKITSGGATLPEVVISTNLERRGTCRPPIARRGKRTGDSEPEFALESKLE